ncbi:MAG TPA: hypothetical protein PLO67_01535 [Saprospiraceae bacterium]|nr:hypothetical protein [Saprospiraceae bacterium]HPI04967.1 hypothetical protein [Saprospiraceae bacterium]
MKHWEKGKKDIRRTDESSYLQQDHKKKKLKPVEKTKYRLRGVSDQEE